MSWNEQFPKEREPSLAGIADYIGNPLWGNLCAHLESAYNVRPRIEHSVCSGAPGWNVKYKKGGRSLCTLYPGEGFFTALVCIGQKEQGEAELLLPSLSPKLRELYQNANPLNGTRWLMIDVTDETILENVKLLIGIRAKKR